MSKGSVKYPSDLKNITKYLKGKNNDITNWKTFDCVMLRPKQLGEESLSLDEAKEAEKMFSKYDDTDDYANNEKAKKNERKHHLDRLTNQDDLNDYVPKKIVS